MLSKYLKVIKLDLGVQ